MLRRHGWQEPPADAYPTGLDLYEAYLRPLADTPAMMNVVETGTRITAITRLGFDKVTSRDRETRPFVLSVLNGTARRDLARAVIDASGTWTTPNPLGAGGVPADGEANNPDKIVYGLPDVLGRDRSTYQGRTIAVIGAGLAGTIRG